MQSLVRLRKDHESLALHALVLQNERFVPRELAVAFVEDIEAHVTRELACADLFHGAAPPAVRRSCARLHGAARRLASALVDGDALHAAAERMRDAIEAHAATFEAEVRHHA